MFFVSYLAIKLLVVSSPAKFIELAKLLKQNGSSLFQDIIGYDPDTNQNNIPFKYLRCAYTDTYID